MTTVNNINFKDKKALVRVDFNVPLNDQFEITDDTRIQRAVPTLKKILNDGGSCIILSHFGRPKNGPEEKFSLKHIVDYVGKVLGVPAHFAADCVGEVAQNAANNLPSGEVLILENTRFHAGETKGDNELAEQMSKLGDVYVNDAFGTAHRAHSSTAVIAQHFTQKCFGLLMAAEVENATKILNESEAPFTAIIGGAKVSDKISILEQLVEKANNIIIGGGMAYTFKKAQGGKIGNSLCEDEKLETANQLLARAKQLGVQIHLPEDSVVADDFNANANTQTENSDAISEGWMGLDIGSKAAEEFKSCILNSKTVLWNGPMGVFEMEKFQSGTKSIALAVAEATKNGAFTLVGGGDSVAAINKFKLADEVSYVSTGGGAMLKFFEGKELPGIKAMQ